MSRLFSTVSNVLVLASGAVGAQIVGLLSLPLLTRIYSPADFGSFAIFFAGSQFLGAGIAGRYEQAIMLASSKAEEAAVVALSMVVAMGVAALATIASWLLRGDIDLALGIDLGVGWSLMTSTALFISINLTLSITAIRHARYSASSWGRFIKALFAVILQIGIGALFGGGIGGLMAGEALANVAAVLVLAFLLRDMESIRIWNQFNSPNLRRETMALARRYRDLPLVNLPHTMLSPLADVLIFSLVTARFSSTDTGQYFMMQRILMLPAGFVGLTVSQLYFRSAAHMNREHGHFDKLVWRVILGVGSISLCLSIVLLTFGREAFEFVLGSQWRTAGELAEIYVPYVGVHLVAAALAPTSRVANKLRLAFALALLQTGVFLAGFWLGMWADGSLAGGVAGSAYLSLPVMIAIITWYLRISTHAGSDA